MKIKNFVTQLYPNIYALHDKSFRTIKLRLSIISTVLLNNMNKTIKIINIMFNILCIIYMYNILKLCLITYRKKLRTMNSILEILLNDSAGWS